MFKIKPRTFRPPSRFAFLSGLLGIAIILGFAGVAAADVEASDRLLGYFSLQTLRVSARVAWLTGIIFLMPLVIELLAGISFEIIRRLGPRGPEHP